MRYMIGPVEFINILLILFVVKGDIFVRSSVLWHLVAGMTVPQIVLQVQRKQGRQVFS